MRSTSYLRSRRSRGQSLVESALVLLVYLVLLIGILDVGQVLFIHQTMVERTRAALRFGAVQDPFNADAVRNMVLYNQPTVPGAGDYEPEYLGDRDAPPPVPGIFGLMPAMVDVQRHDATFNEDRITIRITGYPFNFYTPIIAGLYEGKPIEATIPYEAGN